MAAGGGDLERAVDALRGAGNQTRIGGETVSSNWLLSGHHDRFVLDQKHFQYVRASAQRDRFRDIRLRAALGGGYGWQLIDSEFTELSLRGGLDLVTVDHYGASGHDRYPALGWGIQFSHWLWQHRLKLFFDQDGYWGLGSSAEVTVRTRGGLRMPIAQGLVATAQLVEDRRTAMKREAKRTTRSYSLSLSTQICEKSLVTWSRRMRSTRFRS